MSESLPDGDLVPFPSEISRSYRPNDIRLGPADSPGSQRNIFGTSFADKKMLYTDFELGKLSALNEACMKDNFVFDAAEETQKMRFLQGNEWDIAKTMDSLKEFSKWKKSRHSDVNLTPTRRSNEFDFAYWYGSDKGMRPVLVLEVARLVRRISSQASIGLIEGDLVKILEFFVEKLCVPGHVEQLVVIVDLKNCDTWDAPIEFTQRCAKTLSSYFRSRLNKLFIINTPLLFYTFWRMIKIFVPPRTVAKVNIMRSDYMSILLEQIDLNMIDPSIIPQETSPKKGVHHGISAFDLSSATKT